MRAHLFRLTAAAARPVCLGGAVLAAYHFANERNTSIAMNDRSPELHKIVNNTATRMGKYTHTKSDLLKFAREKNGVNIFHVKEGKIPGGLGVARVAEVEINAPIDQVAELWWHQGVRKQWDTLNTDDSQTVRELDNDTKICYIRSKPKAMLAPRDFCYYVCRVPSSLVGHSFNAQVFVQVDANNEVPADPACVRGNVNSMIVFTPITASKTRATYCVEMNVNGWVPSSVMDMNADDVPMTIGVMKSTLEKDAAVEATQDIETAARARFNTTRRLTESERNRGPSVIDDVTASKEDLSNAIALLEKRYKNLVAEERASGHDYSELKKRMQDDISRGKNRLRRM